MLCFWLVEANFSCGKTNQKHYLEPRSDQSSVSNFCTHSSNINSHANFWLFSQAILYLGQKCLVIQMAFLPKSFGQQSAITCRTILYLMTQWMQVQNSLQVHWKERSVILLPLHPASLTHKNHQKWKIIHGMSPAGHRDRSIIDLNLCICRNISFV